jgi:hypothetical protein
VDALEQPNGDTDDGSCPDGSQPHQVLSVRLSPGFVMHNNKDEWGSGVDKAMASGFFRLEGVKKLVNVHIQLLLRIRLSYRVQA